MKPLYKPGQIVTIKAKKGKERALITAKIGKDAHYPIADPCLDCDLCTLCGEIVWYEDYDMTIKGISFKEISTCSEIIGPLNPLKLINISKIDQQ